MFTHTHRSHNNPGAAVGTRNMTRSSANLAPSRHMQSASVSTIDSVTKTRQPELPAAQPLPHQRSIPSHPWTVRATKRAIDVTGALVFFLIFGWLYLLVALGVLITSGRPVLFWQKRYGRDGKCFPFYKFRSMVPNAEQVLKEYLATNPEAAEEWKKYQKLDNDPRITPFGKFIRKTSLDELPQFWNVLRGDMSLIGPRPCLMSQKELYGSYWGHYTSVRPGITGLWQVSGRNTVSYRRRIALDVRYVERLSMTQDIYIFLKTIWVVLTGHGSK